MARRLKAKGLSLKAIARDLSCSVDLVTTSIYGHAKERAGLTDGRQLRVVSAPKEHEEILVGLARGESMSAIARSLGRAPSSVTREVAANGGVDRYGAWKGHCRAETSSKRPKPAKLAHPPLVRQVSTWLEKLWSPREYAERLRLEYPYDPMMQVSHETIYQSLFVQGRGELRRELARCLRLGAHGPPSSGSRQAGQDPEHGHDQRPSGRDRRSGRCPDTGKVISSSGPPTSQPSAPWSSAPPGSCSSCTCRTATGR